jgi:hypothetical protein
VFKEFFDREKLFRGLTDRIGFNIIFQQILIYTIAFLGIYGLIYGYFVNGMNGDWALRDMIKYPVTFILTILLSSPAYHLLAMIIGCKKDYKETIAIMLSGLFIMSTFTLVFGGILLTLMGINRTNYGIMQATNAGVILLGCLLGAVYFYHGLIKVHKFNDSQAIALVLICGVIFLVILPQAAGLVGPYSSGIYGGGFLEGMSSTWGSAQMTKTLR